RRAHPHRPRGDARRFGRGARPARGRRGHMSGSHVPVRPGLFDETPTGGVHLLGSRCSRCDRYLFPRGELCPFCSSTDVEPVVLSDTGTLWGWTVVHTAPPGYDGPV